MRRVLAIATIYSVVAIVTMVVIGASTGVFPLGRHFVDTPPLLARIVGTLVAFTVRRSPVALLEGLILVYVLRGSRRLALVLPVAVLVPVICEVVVATPYAASWVGETLEWLFANGAAPVRALVGMGLPAGLSGAFVALWQCSEGGFGTWWRMRRSGIGQVPRSAG